MQLMQHLVLQGSCFFPLVTDAFLSFELPGAVTSRIEHIVKSWCTDIPYV